MYRYNVEITLTCDGASVVVEGATGALASGTEKSAIFICIYIYIYIYICIYVYIYIYIYICA